MSEIIVILKYLILLFMIGGTPWFRVEIVDMTECSVKSQ